MWVKFSETVKWDNKVTIFKNTVYILCMCVCALCHAPLFVTPWTVAHQAPLPMGISTQEYWSGLPCPPPEDLPHLGLEPRSFASPALLVGFFITRTTWEALCIYYIHTVFLCLKNWKTTHQTADTIFFSVGGRFLKFDLGHQYLSTLTVYLIRKSEDRAVGGIEVCAEDNREHCRQVGGEWQESAANYRNTGRALENRCKDQKDTEERRKRMLYHLKND